MVLFGFMSAFEDEVILISLLKSAFPPSKLA